MRRPERFAEALKEEIAEVVGFELEDPRVEAVTVTDVVVSQDLRDARVYVVVEGDDTEKKAAMRTLQHAMAFVRQQVALNLDLRHVPHLHFMRDTAEENASRVAGLLDDLEIAGELKSSDEADQNATDQVIE